MKIEHLLMAGAAAWLFLGNSSPVKSSNDQARRNKLVVDLLEQVASISGPRLRGNTYGASATTMPVAQGQIDTRERAMIRIVDLVLNTFNTEELDLYYWYFYNFFKPNKNISSSHPRFPELKAMALKYGDAIFGG